MPSVTEVGRGAPPAAAAGSGGRGGAPTRAAAARAPAPTSPFGGGVWVSCYEHFTPSESARVDATRLAVTCGPSTGLARFEKASGTVDEAGRAAVLRWEGKKRDCYRVFAVAAAPVEDLEVEILESPRAAGTRPKQEGGDRVSLSNRNERWAVAPEEGPFCASEDGFLEARFSTHAGRGEFAAFVYRAEGMVPKKPRVQPPPAASTAGR